MNSRFDLSGKQFGRLTVLRHIGSSPNRGLIWECRCLCGNVIQTTAKVLRSGESQSCGCLNRERTIKTHTKHGLARTPAYKSYVTMLDRCYRANHRSYSKYGGKGITVCESWRNGVENFVRDMGPRPSLKHSLDRIDPNGNYGPSNCRWATATEQQRNRRDTLTLTFKDQSLPLAEWAERYRLPANTLHGRIKLGWSIEKALTTPLPP